jgi:hypothetical protein
MNIDYSVRNSTYCHTGRTYSRTPDSHIHRALSVIIDCSKATSSAAAHLAQPIKGHNLCRTGSITTLKRPTGQLSLREAINGGFEISQSTANAMGNFDVQRFRHTLVLWLLDNNLPIELISRASTRELFRVVSTEVEGALWQSPCSVATYAMRLFHAIIVVNKQSNQV